MEKPSMTITFFHITVRYKYSIAGSAIPGLCSMLKL